MRAQARAESSSHQNIRSYFRNEFQHSFSLPEQSSKYAQDYMMVTCHRLKINKPTIPYHACAPSPELSVAVCCNDSNCVVTAGPPFRHRNVSCPQTRIYFLFGKLPVTEY